MKAITFVTFFIAVASAAVNLELPELQIVKNFADKFNLHEKFESKTPQQIVAMKENLVRNTKKVSEHNEKFRKGLATFDMAEHEYMYMSPEEFISKMTGVKPELAQRIKRAVPQYYANPATCSALPSAKNWVTEGKVQSVKNQGSCGSCYIFAALAVLESQVAIKYSTSPPNYSEQHMLDCIGAQACQGGWHTYVWPKTQTNNGAVETANYNPYTATPNSASCVAGVKKDERGTMQSWEQLPTTWTNQQIMCYLNTHGPLWVAFMVQSDFYSLGPNGVYVNNACGTSVNHAVQLVGYGETVDSAGNPLPYWVMKNSWGTTWGNGGYFKIKRGSNTCNCESWLARPILKPMPITTTTTTTTTSTTTKTSTTLKPPSPECIYTNAAGTSASSLTLFVDRLIICLKPVDFEDLGNCPSPKKAFTFTCYSLSKNMWMWKSCCYN